MTSERLQKYLARCGVASRRASEQIILDGRVAINDRIVTELGTTVDPENDRVDLDGHPVLPPARTTSIALHKPAGVVSTAHDPQGRRTVLDLVDVDARLYPVGRLDYDSEGLIVLTDDGDLALHLTHPRHIVEKEYHAQIRGGVPDAALRRLADGVMIEGRRTAPARVSVLHRDPDSTWVRFVLHEGRNRQIRRMAAVVGLEVARLVRVRIGSLRLDDLPAGAWRVLSKAEAAALRRNAD